MHGKVEICGINTAKLKVLKSDESMALLRRMKEGDLAAREELIAGNLRLVLIKAIDNFNVDLDVKFSTYGVPMIIGDIRRYLRDNSTIRVSRSVRDTAYRVLQAKESYMAEHQQEPTVEEIAKMLALRREDVVLAMDAVVDPVSLFEPVYTDGSDTVCVMDKVRDEKNNDTVWLDHIALEDAIRRLSEREQRILALRFFQGKTQMEVSAEIGISQAQVSRLEKNALNQIRKEL